MGAYLVDHPPVRSQFRRGRREQPSGVVVVHTAENTPDTVATDGGAEAVARFIQTRSTPGSYHTLADSDSRLQLVPWEWEAYQDGTGSNPHAVGLSIATRADWWPWAPQAWRDGAIEHLAQAAAEYARWLHHQRGIVIPARRISRAESEDRKPGFISHAQRDPTRRTDPGAAFPWAQFLGRFAELTRNQEPGGQPGTDPEDEDMIEIQWFVGEPTDPGDQPDEWPAYRVISAKGENGRWYGHTAIHVQSQAHLDRLRFTGHPEKKTGPGSQGQPLNIAEWGGTMAFLNGPFKNV